MTNSAKTRSSKTRRAKTSAPEHSVVVCSYDGVELLDVSGPINVFTAAARLGGTRYRVTLVSETGGAVRTAGGIELLSRRAGTLRGPIDTLLVPGGLVPAAQVVPRVQRLARRARRVAGVCTGALLLADAGLLAGRRAVTHWAACQELQRRAPSCEVEPDSIYVHDGDLWTSAGVTAGMDLALALVEEDAGPRLALEVARWLVMHLRRHGGQSQYSAALSAQRASLPPVRALAGWVPNHLRDDLSVGALARRAGMSPRNFARVFTREIGETPAAWVEQVRLESARAALEGTPRTVKEVADLCGFRSPAVMHRAFQRRLGVTPRQYRARFRLD